VILWALLSLRADQRQLYVFKRDYLLADLIAQNTISDSFHPDWNPDLKAIWPSSHHDPQMALDQALDARMHKRVLLTPQVRSALRGAWKSSVDCCTVTETDRVVPAESDPLSGEQTHNLVLTY
jgi:hypothetical protein